MVRVLGRGLWSVDLGHTAFGGPLRPPKASPQAMHPYQGQEPPFLYLEERQQDHTYSNDESLK